MWNAASSISRRAIERGERIKRLREIADRHEHTCALPNRHPCVSAQTLSPAKPTLHHGRQRCSILAPDVDSKSFSPRWPTNARRTAPSLGYQGRGTPGTTRSLQSGRRRRSGVERSTARIFPRASGQRSLCRSTMRTNSGLIDRLAKEAGYDISERMSFESHDDCAERFVALVAEECAKICDDMSDPTCAHAIRSRFPAPARTTR